ncbi:MAG: hypothetical protein K2K01_02090 [Eubacterium sp.]|nr:hypothetical protein [Eubacterium sp.]
MYLLSEQPANDGIGGLIFVLVFCLAILVFSIFMAIKTSKIRRLAKENLRNSMASKNALFMVPMNHFNGLPIAEGVFTQCFLCVDKIVFEANGVAFNLHFSKLTDVSIKTDVEIQKQYVSSVGGAVAGGIMFGPLGAMIGGRAKQKEIRQATHYLIFTYIDNGEIKYIAFNCSACLAKAYKFVEKFQKIKPAQTQSFDL